VGAHFRIRHKVTETVPQKLDKFIEDKKVKLLLLSAIKELGVEESVNNWYNVMGDGVVLRVFYKRTRILWVPPQRR
jgi:hypothetical protein